MPASFWEYDLGDFVNVPLAATDALKPMTHESSVWAKVASILLPQVEKVQLISTTSDAAYMYRWIMSHTCWMS